ncbi:hypothetical protein LWM68_16170 [Niabella sp. W65]|nr:hypothetical protein [Niabella sp. W65]MCH7364157.1 hypothetical protein [Niabella sp. W65]ULT40033.1 hypothetical protein KRR40_35005 [Niabella sp. I65]
MGQIIFYGLSLVGYFFEKKNLKVKAFFIPYYFCLMNYAVIAGINRYLKNRKALPGKNRKENKLLPIAGLLLKSQSIIAAARYCVRTYSSAFSILAVISIYSAENDGN